MKPIPPDCAPTSRLRHRSALVTVSLLSFLAADPAAAQLAPTPIASAAQLAKYDVNKNGVLDAAELAALRAADAKAAVAVENRPTSENGAVELSPFLVNAEKDDGFSAVNAGTATKLGIDMKDLPAPYSVMTGEFIKAVGITNLQEAVNWSTNGAPVIDSQGADLFLAPSMYNVRGQVINAGQQRNFFLTASILDSYSAERIDFGRGPNAVLFNVGANSVLGGGISTQTKRARTDKDFETFSLRVGSWDLYRTTVDINRRFGDKVALRGNAVWQDKKGYLQDEMSQIRGLTLAGTYDIRPKTQLRLEVMHDRVERSNPSVGNFDNISGWDGTTTFDGPISNAMYSATGTPGTPNSLGQSLTYEGSPQGVWRENNPTYIYVPGQGAIMNWIHMGSTRRGDENSRVPLYSGGRVWTRDGNNELLPFGNWGRQQRPATPGVFENAGDVTMLYSGNLPGDRFGRQIANSNFRLPTKRFSVTPDNTPLFTETTKGAQIGFNHQIAEKLYFELSGDVNENHDDAMFSHLFLRKGFLDINRKLPDGTPNPHFLDTYSQADMQYRERWTRNAGIRANVGYIIDLKKWGNYTLNLTLGANTRKFESKFRTMSLGLAADPREWQAQRLVMRYYWNEDTHPWDSGVPTSLFQKTVVPGAVGADNSYATSTQSIRPRWVLFDWWQSQEKTKMGTFAVAGKWLENKLVGTTGVRFDVVDGFLRNPAPRFGGVPVNPTWDGRTLDDRYFKPDAPADWKTLTYIPKNADGTPRSAVGLPAWDRPTVPGVNGVNPFNPLYANERFRNDYNPPPSHTRGWNATGGIMYHARPWLSVHGNYGSSYLPRGVNTWTLEFDQAKPERGIAYDYGVTLNLFRDRLAVKLGTFFNRAENILGNHSTIGSINSLMGRQAANDPNPDGRNNLGFGNVVGADFFARKNQGNEIEIVGRITRGWRVTANYGSGRIDDYDRFPKTAAYVQAHKGDYLQVLQAAGGMLDTTSKPAGSTSAPGRAVVNPAVTHLRGDTYQQAAVNDYNNIWVTVDQIPALKDFIGIKRSKVNIYTDYTIQEGKLRGLRFGVGGQYTDAVIAGYRSGDTVANPSFDKSQAVTATNRPWMDDPNVDVNTPVWIKQPFDVIGNLGYTKRLRSSSRFLDGKDLELQLTVRNLLNWQRVINQDEGVALRPPGGDFSLPNRTAVPGRIGLFQRPINYELSATLKL